jgi:hypothetical protein
MNPKLVSLLVLALASPSLAEDVPAAPPPAAAPSPNPAPATTPVAVAPNLVSPDAALTLPPPLFHAWPIPVAKKELPVNWWVPPLEIVGFTVGLHAFNKAFNSDPVYDVTWEDIQRHFKDGWVYDKDKFLTNQFAHPYEGSMYFTASRSTGHGFWVSAVGAFIGSWTWEMFAEAEQPSINDQITTTVAGSFLGEILYRFSNVVLDGGGARPGGWREFAALAISPMTGLNRSFYGDTYRPTGMTSPPTFGEFRLGLGAAGAAHATGTEPVDQARGFSVGGEVIYGLAAGSWTFDQPFDYFDLAADLVINKSAAGRAADGNFSIHALLVGTDYGQGRNRGFLGLFGTYDYLTPPAYRVSSSALGFGTTGQVLLGQDFALQGSAILSIGFGAGGQLQENSGNRDYHFGAQAVGYAAGKLIFRDHARLDIGLRQYFTSGKVSPEPSTWEEAGYAHAGLTWRIYGPHAIGVDWTGARRNAYYPDVPSISSRSNQVGVSYSLVSDHSLGLGRLVE